MKNKNTPYGAYPGEILMHLSRTTRVECRTIPYTYGGCGWVHRVKSLPHTLDTIMLSSYSITEYLLKKLYRKTRRHSLRVKKGVSSMKSIIVIHPLKSHRVMFFQHSDATMNDFQIHPNHFNRSANQEQNLYHCRLLSYCNVFSLLQDLLPSMRLQQQSHPLRP